MAKLGTSCDRVVHAARSRADNGHRKTRTTIYHDVVDTVTEIIAVNSIFISFSSHVLPAPNYSPRALYDNARTLYTYNIHIIIYIYIYLYTVHGDRPRVEKKKKKKKKNYPDRRGHRDDIPRRYCVHNIHRSRFIIR